MSDLLTRLRTYADSLDRLSGVDSADVALLREAAAEIERLTMRVRVLEGQIDPEREDSAGPCAYCKDDVRDASVSTDEGTFHVECYGHRLTEQLQAERETVERLTRENARLTQFLRAAREWDYAEGWQLAIDAVLQQEGRGVTTTRTTC